MTVNHFSNCDHFRWIDDPIGWNIGSKVIFTEKRPLSS